MQKNNKFISLLDNTAGIPVSIFQKQVKEAFKLLVEQTDCFQTVSMNPKAYYIMLGLSAWSRDEFSMMDELSVFSENWTQIATIRIMTDEQLKSLQSKKMPVLDAWKEGARYAYTEGTSSVWSKLKELGIFEIRLKPKPVEKPEKPEKPEKTEKIVIMDRCVICTKPVPDYKPEFCCTGEMCGCHGEPTNPCVCSQACEEAVFDYIGMPFEDRRLKAGIQKWGSIKTYPSNYEMMDN